MKASRLRVGLVGTGVIAQVMHLHYLAELADRYEVAAVCDLDADGARACAGRYGIPAAFTDWRDLLGHPLDAVMVLTSGSHAPIAEAAARAGLHVFVEKPMCFSADEGRAMITAAERGGVKLMVGYPKRYDPAFARMREETAQLTGARLLRVTTFESPLRPYIEPVGYLGRGDELGEALARHRLGLAGAYVELPYSDPDALEGALDQLDAVLDTFELVRSYLPGPPPRPTLADSGSKRRNMLPARSVRDQSLGFDADGWKRFAAGLARVIARCRDRGYEPTFHPETGTYVEAPWEIERVLEVSDIGLCLETGHMMLGGGDPVTMLRDLGDRVNHVHLKDARLTVMNEIVADQAPVTEIWTREAFCALGGGDLDVDAVLAGLRKISFGGWLVVEQDILPRSAGRFAQAAQEQRHNRAFLAERGL